MGQRCWLFAVTKDQVARANNSAKDLTERYPGEEVIVARSREKSESGYPE